MPNEPMADFRQGCVQPISHMILNALNNCERPASPLLVLGGMNTQYPEKPYLCYIHREGGRLADLMVITCDGDHALNETLTQVLAERSFLRVEVFDGERRVALRHPPHY